mmetsp:Transcript_67063/g.106634  ORF Transcript_67063/g.106634 Transcript_67063/m.106634 type:complete len:206 (+) Transcript_67063:47-664(+)|eukprot:CAMPEP_0197026554 /NCGR_PEP_ID=MMETSP1384-20130603/6620_1 /TAXON_ID=29189 /ORGANISM="Ammonia sp." /LENGTH=205 /DNA_ID=CAMNT_0042455241 /DNA_START=35 /DNA_END=652 /DNA_ORIENTATION=+
MEQANNIQATGLEKKEESELQESQDDSNLVWVDCEFTGLDVSKHRICEMAVLVTDKDLKVLEEGPNVVIRLSDTDLNNMSDWCKKTFSANGLLQQIQEATVDMEKAQSMVLQFVQKYCPPKRGVLCGNSIWSDKKFLARDMPQFHEYLAHRIIDVSSFKEVCRRWYPAVYAKAKQAPKPEAHRAMDDIKLSIKELQFYRANIFAN